MPEKKTKKLHKPVKQIRSNNVMSRTKSDVESPLRLPDSKSEFLTSVYFLTDSKGRVNDRYIASSPTRVIEHETGRTSFTWSANRTSVNLAWWKPADVDTTWIISRNGVDIAQTTSNRFTDTDPRRYKASEYSVRANITITKTIRGRKFESQQEYRYGAEIPEVETSSLGASITDSAILSTESNRDVFVASKASALADGSVQYTYESFIPEAKIKQPVFCTNRYDSYNGNNRGFRGKKNFNANLGYKGQNRGNVTVYKNKKKLDFTSNKVGETLAYNKQGKVVARKTEGNKNMSVTLRTSAGKPALRFRQSIGNPLCQLLWAVPAPNIDVDMNAAFDPAGRTAVYGRHDGAPNHELTYSMANSKGRSYGCLYRFQHRDFSALAATPEVIVDLSSQTMNGKFPRDCVVRK